jgi:hypothetical protein
MPAWAAAADAALKRAIAFVVGQEVRDAGLIRRRADNGQKRCKALGEP